MRTILFTILLVAASFANAQQAVQPAQPPSGSNWQHVQALPIGASINVKARTGHLSCALKNVDADSLTCVHGKDTVFQRTDIQKITIPRRGRSALIGTAIGGGAGAVTGFALATDNNPDAFFGKNAFRGAATAIMGILGAGIGAATGGLTDFAHSTVYKTP